MTTPGAVLVIAPIEPSNDAPFHVVADQHLKGGAHAVVDTVARDALPSHLLTPGTIAAQPDGSLFVWNGSAWSAVAGGGGAVTSVAGRIGDVVLSTADISGLGNSATRDVGTVAGTVAAGDDARLADARVPLAHTHTVSDLTGLSSQVLVGRHAGGVGAGQEVAVDGGLEFQGANLRRAALSGDVTAPAGSSTTTIAAGAVTDAKVAASNKDGLATTPSMRTLGTGAQQAAAGNDPRLSDPRTPTAHAASHASGGADELSNDSISLAKLENQASGRVLGTVAGSSGPVVALTQSQARTTLGLGTAATADVGTTSGTVSAGDDARLLAAAAAAARIGVEVLSTDTETIDTATQATKLRAAGGAVTLDVRADNLVGGNDTTTRITNTTGVDVVVSVVAVGLDWYTDATATVPTGKSAVLSLLPTTSTLSGVLASLVVSA